LLRKNSEHFSYLGFSHLFGLQILQAVGENIKWKKGKYISSSWKNRFTDC
jgi:hypothetical protein